MEYYQRRNLTIVGVIANSDLLAREAVKLISDSKVDSKKEWYKKFSKTLNYLLPNEMRCGNILFVRLSARW